MLYLPKITNQLILSVFTIFFCVNLKAQASFTLNSAYCVGDTIKVVANTGTISATSFSWTSSSFGPIFSASNQAATNIIFSTSGNYTIQVLVSSGTETSSAMEVVTVNALPIVTLSSSAPFLCSNQSATLTASGALSYVWTPTLGLYFFSNSLAHISPIATVVYTLEGTDSLGCMGSTTYTVNVFNYPTLVVQASSPNVCLGSTSTLTANGASNYTWTSTSLTTISNQSTVAVGPGTYSLLGSNGGCKDSIAVVIGVAPSLTLEVNKSRDVICTNDGDSLVPISLSASGAFLYKWEPYNPAYMSFSLGAVTAVSPTISTCYTLTGSANNCEMSKIICVTVATCTSLEKIEEALEVSIFQNPMNQKVVVQLKNSNRCILRVYNLSSRLMLEKEIIKNESKPYELVLNDLNPGMYLLDIVADDGRYKRTKIIKE